MSAPYQVALTPEALADLDRLERFLRPLNPNAADKMLVALDGALTRLAENPQVGRPSTTRLTTRELTVRFGKGAYLLRYEIFESQVLIARAFHGREQR